MKPPNPVGHEVTGHTPHLAHHFDTPEQQHEAAKLGMWIFLATEMLIFGGLFTIYAVYRALHPEVFEEASRYLDVWLGMINTMVLITSSLTMALSIWAARRDRRGASSRFLAATLVLGAVFLCIKYFEYRHKFELGIYPGKFYTPIEAAARFEYARNFFSIYYAMTGLHGLHVFLGMVVIAWLLRRSMRGDFSAEYYTPLELTGLYWHLVDMIWIYLFPLFYLIH